MFMLKQKKSIFKTITVTALALGAFACGSKVAGTYTLSINGGSSAMYGGASSLFSTYCQNVQLTVNSNSNMVNASGSGGQGCNENLQGTENGQTISVSSFSVSVASQTCTFSGSLNVVNNVITGTLQPMSTYYGMGSGAACMQPITINGTKIN
jgi:hypothetical protein